MGTSKLVVSDRTLYLNADRTHLVEEGDEDAAFLFVREGALASKDEASNLKGAKLRGDTVDAPGAVPSSQTRDTEFVVVKEPHQAPGNPAVEGAGKSTKPVTLADQVGSRPESVKMTEAPEEPQGDPAATPEEAEREAGIAPAEEGQEGASEEQGSEEE